MNGIEEGLKRHLEKLVVEVGERSVVRPGALQCARGYLEEQFHTFGYRVCPQMYSAWGLEFANVVASKTGGGSRAAIVVGAHYDTVIGSPGADDNGSAVAVMLEAARMLSNESLPCPVEFVGFALEEPPAFATLAQGSRVYARRARAEGREIGGMICLEMVGYCSNEPGSQRFPPGVRSSRYPDTGNFIGIVANNRSKKLMNKCVEAYRKSSGIPVYTLCVPGFLGRFIQGVDLSDHASFWDEGYHAVMVTDTSFCRNPYYHSPGDTVDTLDLDFMTGVVKGLVASVRSVAGGG